MASYGGGTIPDKAKPVRSTGFAIASGVKRPHRWCYQDTSETMALAYRLASITETVTTATVTTLRCHMGWQSKRLPVLGGRFQAAPFLL